MAVDDAYTKVLLHFNGDDEGTVITDEAGNTWTRSAWTPPVVDLVTDQAQKVFGSASLRQATWNEYLNLSGGFTAAMNPAAMDFTIDFRFRMSVLPIGGQQLQIEWYSSSTNRLDLSILEVASPTYCFQIHAHAGGVNLGSMSFGSGAPVTLLVNTFYHIEFCRNGNNYLLFLDGTLLDTVSVSAHTFELTGADWSIYYGDANPAWLDELRYSVGTARHTGEFTPSITEYGPTAPTVEVTINETGMVTGSFVPDHMVDTIAESGTIGTIMLEYLPTAFPNEVATISDVFSSGNYFDDNEDEVAAIADVLDSSYLYSITVNDVLNIAGSATSGWNKTVNDGMYFQADAYPNWGKTVNETIDIDDTATKVLAILAQEWFNIQDTNLNMWHGVESVSDAFVVYDDILKQIEYSVTDNLAIGLVTDVPTAQLGLRISDWLIWDSLIVANSKISQQVYSPLTIYDDAVNVREILREIADSFEIGLVTDVPSYQLGIIISELLSSLDSVIVNGKMGNSIESSLLVYDDTFGVREVLREIADSFEIGLVTDIPTYQLGLKIAEWLNYDSSVTSNWKGIRELASGLYIYDGVTGTKWIVRTIADELVIGQEADELKLDLGIALLEHIGFHSVVYVMTTVNLEEILNSQDEARGAYHFTPEDSMAIVDSESVNTMMCNVTINDVIDVLGEVIGKSTLNRVIMETITIRDL